MIIVNACQKDLFRVDLNILQVIWHDIDLYFCQFSQNVTRNCLGFVYEFVYLFFGLPFWSMDDKIKVFFINIEWKNLITIYVHVQSNKKSVNTFNWGNFASVSLKISCTYCRNVVKNGYRKAMKYNFSGLKFLNFKKSPVTILLMPQS